MSIIGKLKDLGLADILQIISMGRRTGVLTVIGKGSTGKLVISEGRVYYASSDNINRLGYTLVQKGLVKAQDLDYALQAQKSPAFKKPLGAILLVMGFIDREVLAKEIRSHIVRAFKDFMSWEEGIFFFEAEEIEKENLVIKEGFKIEHLLLERARITDEEGHVFDRELW